MKIHLNRENLTKVLIFLVIYLSCSFVVTNDIWSSPMVIALWIAVFGLVLVGNSLAKGKIAFNIQSPLFVTTILLICIWTTDIVRSENLINTAKNTFAFATVALFACYLNYDDLRECFLKVFEFVCAISIVLFTLYHIFPALSNINVVQNLNGQPYSCLYIYIDSHIMIRNMGFFWEPGAFGSFICIALLFELTGRNINVKRLVLFLVTVITTFSTTSYIATILIVLYALMLRYDMNKKTKWLLVFLIIVALIGVFFNYELFFGKYGASTVFGKLLRYFEGTSHSRYTSTSIRINAVIYDFLAYLEKPLIGFGYDGLSKHLYEYTLGRNTCTFINWYSVYGTLFGLIMTVGYYKFCKKMTSTKLHRVILLTILFVIIISENYVNNPFFILICLLGYVKKKENKEAYRNV